MPKPHAGQRWHRTYSSASLGLQNQVMQNCGRIPTASTCYPGHTFVLQVEARIGEPKNRMAAALRKCFAMRDPEVIDCVANLGTVRHEDLNRLLSKLHSHYMQLLIVETPAASRRLSEHLQSERVQCSYHMQDSHPLSCWHTGPYSFFLWWVSEWLSHLLLIISKGGFLGLGKALNSIATCCRPSGWVLM